MKNNKIVIILEHGVVKDVISESKAEIVVIDRDVSVGNAAEDSLEYYADSNVVPLFASCAK